MNVFLPTLRSIKLAIVGGGISGMGAAYNLSKNYDVTLFESKSLLGGHARTVLAGKRGNQPVDMGFIVFNYPNYPSLANLFSEIQVPTIKSEMSFGASIKGGLIEYGLKNLNTTFGQRHNVFRPKFIGMLLDILKFNSRGLALAQNKEFTISEFLDELGTGEWFKNYYLLPLSGAIWSTPTEGILDFPANTMMNFFENHALLHHTGQHQWYTIKNGSVEYVSRLEKILGHRGGNIRKKAPVSSVCRRDGKVCVRANGGLAEEFDEVIFATHSDDTLSILADADVEEKKLLGAIRYQSNDIILHADCNVMPKSRRCWSSWIYKEDQDKKSDKIDLSYWMNSLQCIPSSDPLFVSLNPIKNIKSEYIYEQTTMRHPVYDKGALKAQLEITKINGRRQTWFCGAWMKNGFHEDGLVSSLDVAQKIKSKYSLGIAAE